MASSQTLYSISITNSNSNISPNDGFVDNTTIEQYYASLGSFTTTPSGLTLNLCKAKVRGNTRYREIINQMAIVSNTYVTEQADVVGTNTMPSVSAPGGSGTTEPTSISFYVIVEHGDASLITADELNPGQYLTSTACLQRCVARALINDMFREVAVFDPTEGTTTGSWGSTASWIRYGTRIYNNTFEIGPYVTTIADANPLITVTQVTF